MEENSKEIEIQQDNLSPLVKLALNSNIDIGKLEKLIEVQDKFDQKQAKKEFYKAFSKFKQNDLVITKDSTVDFKNLKGQRTLYKHASLGNIMSVVGPLLSVEGLALSWIPVQDGKGISVTAVLSHTLGFSIDATLFAPPDMTGNKGGLQALGSTVTYLSRYTAVTLLGLAMTNDDDGRSTCEPPKNQNQKPEQKPFYSNEDFEKNFPVWEAGIKNGGNTIEGIIRILEKKSELTTDQKTLIREIK